MMDIKVSKDKTLADGLIKRTSSMLDETESKTVHNTEEGDRLVWLSHTEQECQDSLIQGKIHNEQNWNKGLKYS